jgi:hypothetical protein
MLGREKQLFYSGKHGHGKKMRHRMPFAWCLLSPLLPQGATTISPQEHRCKEGLRPISPPAPARNNHQRSVSGCIIRDWWCSEREILNLLILMLMAENPNKDGLTRESI